MRRKRPLTPDEERLWHQTMRDTKPLSEGERIGDKGDKGLAKRPKPQSRPHANSPQHLSHRSSMSQSGPSHTPQLPSLHNIDRSSAQKVRRGRIDVDGKVDLHGLRQAEAHDTLIRRLLSAQSRGKRIILVVTGKGRSATDRPWAKEEHDDPFTGRGGGVLKAQVPMWLSQEPLRGAIHSVQEAHPKHGGSGALYVFLKRQRA